MIVFLAALSLASCAALLKEGAISRVAPSSDDGGSGDLAPSDGTGETTACEKEKCAVCEESLLNVDELNLEQAVKWRETLAGLGALDTDQEVIDLEAKIEELVNLAIDYPSYADDPVNVGARFYGSIEALHSYASLCAYGFDKIDNLMVVNSSGILDEINFESLSAILKMPDGVKQLEALKNNVTEAQNIMLAWGEFEKQGKALDDVAKQMQALRLIQINDALKGAPSADPKFVWRSVFACTFCANISSFKLCKGSEIATKCETFNKDPLGYYSKLKAELDARNKKIDELMADEQKAAQAYLDKALADAEAAVKACDAIKCAELDALKAVYDAAKQARSDFEKDSKAWMALNWQPYIALVEEKIDIRKRLDAIAAPCTP